MTTSRNGRELRGLNEVASLAPKIPPIGCRGGKRSEGVSMQRKAVVKRGMLALKGLSCPLGRKRRETPGGAEGEEGDELSELHGVNGVLGWIIIKEVEELKIKNKTGSMWADYVSATTGPPSTCSKYRLRLHGTMERCVVLGLPGKRGLKGLRTIQKAPPGSVSAAQTQFSDSCNQPPLTHHRQFHQRNTNNHTYSFNVYTNLMITLRWLPLRGIALAFRPYRSFHATTAACINYTKGGAAPWKQEELDFLVSIVTTSAATVLRLKKAGIVPGVVRGKDDVPWTKEEEMQLLKMATTTPGYRKLFQEKFPGRRTDNAIWLKVLALEREGHKIDLRTKKTWTKPEYRYLKQLIEKSKTVDTTDKTTWVISEFMLEYPNRSTDAVHKQIHDFNKPGSRRKRTGENTPWTDMEYQTFKNHPTHFFRAKDEVLLLAFPNHADKISSIRQRIQAWRRQLRIQGTVAEKKAEEEAAQAADEEFWKKIAVRAKKAAGKKIVKRTW
ncbi:hypothetical protein K440DRAFT_665196 [Wilcoxina mikolae CBS 423.85]|nr:hypothetical protein K440DRAFT_665196 [Wilcoxina mikolae CBS 423.85]